MNREIYYIVSKKDGFFHLITNPANADLANAKKAKENGMLSRVDSYLQQVENGDGKRPHCPFVKMIAKANGYHVRPFKMADLDASISELEKCFKEISPKETTAEQRPDPTTAVAAFFEEESLHPEFCSVLAKKRSDARLHFLNQGLMIAEMHPHHMLGSGKEGSVESDEKLYVAVLPLLMVRRMHKEDHVFMHTDAEKAAYVKYFGEIPGQTCPFHQKK